ncbi:MAG: MraZ protein [Candidatus Poriferisodalaceae bacterium]
MDDFFVGRYEHSLDAKGRIVLPAAFRTAFESSGFLIKGEDGCLALVTPAHFGDIAREVSGRGRTGGERHRHAKRSFGSGAAKILPDKQGRIAIPEELRDFAHLERDCVIIGSIDEIEIWDVERWATVNETGEDVIESPDEHQIPGPLDQTTGTPSGPTTSASSN